MKNLLIFTKEGSKSLLLLLTISTHCAFAQIDISTKVELSKVRDGLITQFAMKDSNSMYVLKEYSMYTINISTKRTNLVYFFGEKEDSLKSRVKSEILKTYGCMYEFDMSLEPAKFQSQFGVSNFYLGTESVFAIMHIAMPTISYDINDKGQIQKFISRRFFFFMAEVNHKSEVKNIYLFDKHAQMIESKDFFSGGLVQLPNNKFVVYSNGSIKNKEHLYYAVEYEFVNNELIKLSGTYALDSLSDILSKQPQYSTQFISSGIYGEESILCFKNVIQKFDKKSIAYIDFDYNIIGVIAKLPNSPSYLLAVASEENKRNYILKYDFETNNETVINEFENIFYLVDTQGIYIHTITSDGKYFFYERYALRDITK